MKLSGPGASPPKTPDVTPHASKPDVKPTPDAGKPSSTPADSGNGGSRATGNFSNVAQGTGALASGGSAIYRADQSTQNAQYGAQSSTGAVNYGGPAGSANGPSAALQSQPSAEQNQGLSNNVLSNNVLSNNGASSKSSSPLLQLLDKLITSLLQPFGGGAKAHSADSGSAITGNSARAQTKDAHVAEKGSGLTSAAGEAGKALWMIPGASNVLTGIGESDGSVGGMIKGGVEGGVDIAKGAAEGLLSGRGNPGAMLAGAYAGALSETKAAPESVRNVAGAI